MAAPVIEIEDFRTRNSPHFVIDCHSYDGSVHVVPAECVRRWITGENELPEASILRRIISEWAALVLDMETPEDA